MYEIVNLDTGESVTRYAALSKARAAARKLRAYEINHWESGERLERVEHCDPYDGDDNRVRQAMGDAPWEPPS